MDYRIKILVVLPLILMITLIVLANSIHLKGEPSEIERRILEFSPSDIKIKQKQISYTITTNLKSPIDFGSIGSTQDGFPPVSLDALAPQPTQSTTQSKKEELSLIVIGTKARLAILNGIIVKEGDDVNGIKIDKIEPNRILVRTKLVPMGGTAQWMYMEKQ